MTDLKQHIDDLTAKYEHFIKEDTQEQRQLTGTIIDEMKSKVIDVSTLERREFIKQLRYIRNMINTVRHEAQAQAFRHIEEHARSSAQHSDFWAKS